MPTSGLVLSLNLGADLASVSAALRTRPGITVGIPVDNRLPVVTVTCAKSDDRLLWDWLWKLPGIAAVDVAFIYWEESHRPEAPEHHEDWYLS